PRRERVDADGQMRPVRLEGTDGQEHHRPSAIEGVEGGRRHLLQPMNAQKLLPFVAASHSLFARSSSPLMVCPSPPRPPRRPPAPCGAANTEKRRRLRTRPAPAM